MQRREMDDRVAPRDRGSQGLVVVEILSVTKIERDRARAEAGDDLGAEDTARSGD